MADVIDTPLRLFAELTTAKALAGRFQIEVQRRVEQDGVEVAPVQTIVLDCPPDEGAAILASDAARLSVDVQAAHAQIAVLQTNLEAVTKERDALAASLASIAQAMGPLVDAHRK